MEISRAQFKRIRTLFFGMGVVGLVSALGIALYACVVLRPKLSVLNEQMRGSLHDMDHVAAYAADESSLLANSLDTARASRQLLALLPQMLGQLRALLLNASNAAQTAGQAAKETQKGVAGAVLPKQEVKQSGEGLKNTGQEMHALAKSVGKISGASTKVSSNFAGVVDELPSDSDFLSSVRARLQSTEQALAVADLPTQAMLLALTLSGIFALLGGASLGISLILRDEAP